MKLPIALICVLALNLFAQSDNKFVVEITCEREMFVKINDVLVGKTPLKVRLAEGKHHVFLYDDIRQWGFNKVSDTLRINKNSDRVFIYNVPNTNLINTIPQNAKLIARGFEVGYTPMHLGRDFENFELYKRGYDTLGVSMANVKSGVPLKLNNALNFPIQEEKFIESTWFKIFISSAIVFGAASAFFKSKADNKYAQYQQNPTQNLLDQTEIYDTYAGISLTLMEINFGAILYFMMEDYF